MNNKEPLAYRMCPNTLDEYVGQDEIVGEGKLLNRMIKADRLSSIILWGPPGVGKTALAKIISNTTKTKFAKINATSAGVSDIKDIVADSINVFTNPSGKVVLFIDEIHRFNKLQQDILLPYVEKGIIILIGATTENPYFEVNKALISRSTVFKLKCLNKSNIISIIKKALINKEKGFGNIDIDISHNSIELLADIANGDARTALSALELAVLTTDMDKDGKIKINKDIIGECLQKKILAYDKSSSEHYDTISAFIKSMRGSSPDSALLYLAKMLSAGEDPNFIARRIMICASEDVGLANPNALVVATAAAQAVHMVGLPEARIILAEATVYVAISPKSNASYVGINKAISDIQNKDVGDIPLHLKNAVFDEVAKEHGYGQGYKYAHDYEGNWVRQQYMPDKMVGTIYYNPTKNGYESKIEIKERNNID